MADLLILAAPLLMLAFLYCGWRALRLLACWRPATARVVRGGYGDLDRQEDFWIGPDHLTTRGWSPFDAEDHREIEDMVEFEDADGQRYRTSITRQVRQGWRPDSLYTIWYDPGDPYKATAHGPGSWLIAALAAGGALAWLFMGGAGLVGQDLDLASLMSN